MTRAPYLGTTKFDKIATLANDIFIDLMRSFQVTDITDEDREKAKHEMIAAFKAYHEENIKLLKDMDRQIYELAEPKRRTPLSL